MTGREAALVAMAGRTRPARITTPTPGRVAALQQLIGAACVARRMREANKSQPPQRKEDS